MKRIAVLTIVLILTMTFVLGCGAAVTTTTKAAATTGAATTIAVATTSAATTQAANTSAKKLKMYYITKVLGSTYWSVVEAGVRKAAGENNTEVVFTGLQSEADVEKQVQLLQDAVAAKPDAILIAPCDSTAMAKPISDAFKTGIPIILIDTKIKSDDFNAVLATDNTQAGAVCAEQMLKQLKAAGATKATVGVIAASSGSQTVQERLTGFMDFWNKNAPSADWKVLMNEIKYNDASVDKAMAATQDIMTAHPECNAIWTVNNSCTVGAGTVLKEMKKKDLILVGMDFSTDTEDLLKAGFVKTAIIQQQYVMGYQGVKLAIDVINKKTVTKSIDTGVFFVDISNINTPEAEAKMYPAGRPVKK